MYPVNFGASFPHQFFDNRAFYPNNMPQFYPQPQYHHQQFYPGYFQNFPVHPINNTTVIVINQPPIFSNSMQLPQSLQNSPQNMGANTSPYYNSYLSTVPNSSRPIQINSPVRALNGEYNISSDRVMGLDFEPPQYPTTTNNTISSIDSVYFMDFMDDENLPATSNQNNNNNSSNVFQRINLATEDNKENSSSKSVSPPKKESSTSSSFSKMSMNISGEPGMRSFKRGPSIEYDHLIHEETESEAGFSGDDDCISNCGCVHSCIGSPIDFAVSSENNNNNFENIPFTRLGFRSIGDIIGYAQVVRAERLEALAELRNAVDKFNDMRQRKQNLRSPKV
jgi:hypothetical protein